MTCRSKTIGLCLLAVTFGLATTSGAGAPPPSPPPGPLRPTLVAISVPDLAASVRWYEDLLAFRVVKEANFPDYKLSLAILARDDFRLELVQVVGSAPPSKLVPGIDNPALIQGIGKLAFAVSDLDAWASRFKSMGVQFQVAPREDPEDGTRSFVILDNSGNWLQFITARPGG